MRGLARGAVLVLLFVAAGAPAGAKERIDYAKDVAFALEQLERRCRTLLEVKGIDWNAVERTFQRDAKKVKTLADHYTLLVRLVARLEDGHARVEPLPDADSVPWPLAPKTRQTGPGLFWCESRGRVLVKNAWSAASDAGIRPGMEVVKVDRQAARTWLEQQTQARRDLQGFSTDHQASYATCHWGLAGDEGSPLSLELVDRAGDRKKVTVTRRHASVVPEGPAFPPPRLETLGRQRFGKTPAGYAYVHLRDVPDDLPAQLDTMLAAVGDAPGLILDLRSNGGGGCDHEAVLGRFVPAGTTLSRKADAPVPSAGAHPYAWPVVVIVDPGVRSAGETLAGMFKEDGRAYLIGEGPTAGMSSQKERFTLPSGHFALYVSVRSNMLRLNGGRGIEGIGIAPHEVVPYEAEDLAEEVDTPIRRAQELLADFPQAAVPYRPPGR